MRLFNKIIDEKDVEYILTEFDYTLENEISRKKLPIVTGISANIFPELDDFYTFFEHEIKDREELLQDKLFRRDFTEEEYYELEEIAMIKYPEIPTDEVADFYIFTHPKNDENKRLILTNIE